MPATANRDDPWRFAAHIAAALEPPEPVYVLDVCECDGELHLLELNPFSGADLYDCDLDTIVRAVAHAVQGENTST